MIVADTGAIVALVDADDRHHAALASLFESDPQGWALPWAILPEVDYLLATRLGAKVQQTFLNDLSNDAWMVEWGRPEDLQRARELSKRHKSPRLGLVDCVVMAVAERLNAEAIATLDLRDFGAVRLRVKPRLIPRDF